ncbi:DUF4073 domain-containing protein [Paenibacillus xylanexedens]|uniref:DUF4073 domain-containing protein n=1 Tax=Paenibacillus xylanexedens TaxID=528191 RepID=UPI0011AAF196|nr:DUF4073 domain-containing protein [Paenibacillus xylanexedens]
MDISKKLGVTAIATIALTLSTAVHSSASAASSLPFKDVEQASPWAKAVILEAQEKKFMSGDPKGYFHPLQQVTRQEAAVSLAKLMGLELNDQATSKFSDVTADSWSASAIEAVQKAGWMNGDPSGMFRPQAVVTREELASILARATQADPTQAQVEELSKIKDHEQISTWAKKSVTSVVSSGLMTGNNGSFHPQQPVLRQELAAILVRMDSTAVNSKLQTIQKVENGTVTIGNKQYGVAEALKPLFDAKNAEVLANAGIRVTTVDGQIIKVLELKLVTPGRAAETGKSEFSGNVVLDGGQAVISGNVRAAADYITIRNLDISGDLEISKELENDFYAEKVTVKGTTYVKGGDDNTVVFDQSSLQGMNISKEDVRVESVNKTVVKEVHIDSKLAGLWGDESITYETVTVGAGVQNASLYAHIRNLEVNAGREATSISGTGRIDSLTIQGAGTITLQGTGVIGSVTITDRASQVSIPANASIQRLVLPEGVSPERVIANYDKVKTQIASINGVSNPTFVQPSSGGSNSSTSGGSTGNSGGGAPSNPGTPSTPANPDPTSWYPYTYKSYQDRTENSAVGLMTTNKSGTVYYMAVRADDRVRPTAEQVKNGSLPDNLPSTHGMFSVTANQPVTYKVEGLEPSKTYHIYTIFKNGETGQETQPMFIHSIMNYIANDISVLPYDNSNLNQIRIQFSGVLTPPATSTTNPAAIFKDGHLRNYGYGFIEIKSINWDLTIPNMPILNVNFDPVTLGDGTSYSFDWTYVKNALTIKDSDGSGSRSFGGHGSYSGPNVVSLITKQLSIETGNGIDPTKAEDIMHILGAYPSELKKELGLIEFNGQHYQKALAEKAGQYSSFSDVKQIIETTNQQYPAPSNTEATVIRNFNSAGTNSITESYLIRYADTLHIDAAQYSSMNQAARTEVAKMILSERSLLPENKFISIEQIRHAYEVAYTKSSSMPLSLSFVDTDKAAGTIGGEINWTPGTDDTAVVSYQLMWGNTGGSLATIKTLDKSDGNSFTLPQGTSIPDGATHLLIQAVLQDGTHTAPISIAIKDTLPSAPEQPTVTEDDKRNILVGANASMEFSLDNGQNWITYDEANPPVFPGEVFVRVRVKADPDNQVPAGKSITVTFGDNVKMYVGHNDADNMFEANYMSSAMEYSVDAGLTWTTYNVENPQQFPGDLTVLVREKGGRYLDAAPAKEFKFTSKVHVMSLNNSISTSLPTLEYSKNDGEWAPLLVDQTVSFQTGDSVRVREAAQPPFQAGAIETFTF